MQFNHSFIFVSDSGMCASMSRGSSNASTTANAKWAAPGFTPPKGRWNAHQFRDLPQGRSAFDKSLGFRN